MIKHLIIVITVLLVASTTMAQVPVGSEFPVGSHTTSPQTLPAVAMAPDGGFVVVWTSDGSAGDDTSERSVQGQRYASDGRALGSQFQVNSYTTRSQAFPGVAVDSEGDFVVVWSSYGSDAGDTSGYSVQAQRFASDGSAVGLQFQVNSYTTDFQIGNEIAMDSEGNFVVVWSSVGSDDGDTSASIQGQRYSSDGSALGSQFQVNSYTTGNQFGGVIGMAANGDFVVVWHSFGSDNGDPSSSSIQGQRFAADGSALGAQFLINSYTRNGQRHAAAAAAPNGDFVVTWHSYGSSGGDTQLSSIQARRFSSDGSALGSQFQVNSFTANYQFYPMVAMGSDGDFTVVWEDHSGENGDPDPASVQGQRYSADGSALGSQFLVNTLTTNWQGSPAIAAAPGGEAVVVWEVYDQSFYTVHGQLFCPDDDGDGVCNALDICLGDTTSGDSDGDGICDDVDRCDSSDRTNLCLSDDRFKVEVEWRDFKGAVGVGTTVDLQSKNAGLFWFFSANNWEMLVKVLNGCGINNHFWVFAAATTNVEYTLRVTDTQADQMEEYANPLGRSSPAITDTSALATCP